MPKVILISGGSDGLGKAIAKKLVPGNQVVILAHNKTKLEAAAKELNCDFTEGELTDFQSLETAVKKVIEKYQKIDVLVNNAGVWMEGQLDESDPVKIKEVIDINTTGTIFLTKAVIPDMLSKKSGQIINIISQDGLCAKKDRSVYHASKWAITGFTKCLQEDMEGENIKVTAVYPGLMKTSLFEKNNVDRDLTDALDPSEVADIVEYVINLSSTTYIPEVSIKNKLIQTPNMDNTNAPTIDLNIDPNMIAAQDDSPQSVVQKPQPVSAPVKNPGVIDITPGSTDVFPPVTNMSNHIDAIPLSEPKVVDISPPVPQQDSVFHLSEITPAEQPKIIEDSGSKIIETAPVNNPVVPETPLAAPIVPTETAPIAPIQPESTTAKSSLAEDPDLVKLVK